MRNPAASLTRTILLAAVMASGACAGRTYIQIGPPPRPVEVMSPAPGEFFVWLEGTWTWDEYVYIWTPGRWVRAPHAHAEWIAGEWRRSERGYYWVPGHWR